MLRTSGHPLHGFWVSEAFFVIGVDGQAPGLFVVAERLGGGLWVVEDFAGVGVDAVDVVVGELLRFVDLLRLEFGATADADFGV